uniref:Uncharacterized protein n=1 Tax=Rhizophora mucronata TaxID=61149 RepID=A0A2P2NDS0_RHIMU
MWALFCVPSQRRRPIKATFRLTTCDFVPLLLARDLSLFFYFYFLGKKIKQKQPRKQSTSKQQLLQNKG